MKSTLLSMLCAAACFAHTAHAQYVEAPFDNEVGKNQYRAILAPIGIGAGPGSFGVQTGKSLVTLYGSVDLAMNYINAGGKSALRMQSGNVWTSKLGFYGQEDLGGQTTVFFRLESGFYANNGAIQSPSSFFNRGAFVGLQNPRYGQLTLGHQLTSLGIAALGADTFYVNGHDAIFAFLAGVSDLGTGATLDALGRVPNTLRYVSPRLDGFNVDVSYSLKSTQTPGPAVHSRSAAINYVGYGTTAAVSYGQTWCDPGLAGSCTGPASLAPTIRTDDLIAGIVHDFGPVVGQFAYLRTDPKLAGDGIANLYIGGVQKMWHGNLLRASIGYRATTVDKDYAYGTTLGVDHFLSKRTALYARVGWLRNGPNSNLTYNFDATSPSTTVSNGHSISSVTIGMYTNF
ncbi:porin [Burkholderia sp. TJI49]|nr:porin [Burkholderia sp. TJI49]